MISFEQLAKMKNGAYARGKVVEGAAAQASFDSFLFIITSRQERGRVLGNVACPDISRESCGCYTVASLVPSTTSTTTPSPLHARFTHPTRPQDSVVCCVDTSHFSPRNPAF
jgi:hypothetical protein